jgi:CBS domain-containing protein
MATVADLLKQKGKKVFSVSSQTSIHDALILLADHNVGALPIVDDNNLVGIFSERDLARLQAKPKPTSLDTPLEKVMTKKVYTITPATKTEECMQMMTDKHIRHLPVIDDEKLIGIISIGDVLKAVINTQQDFIKRLQEYISGSW